MIVHNAKALAAALQGHRKKQRLSQSDFAQAVGLKQSTVSAFENKPEGTKLDTLFRLLSAANLELDIRPKDQASQQDDWNEEW